MALGGRWRLILEVSKIQIKYLFNNNIWILDLTSKEIAGHLEAGLHDQPLDWFSGYYFLCKNLIADPTKPIFSHKCRHT